MIGKPTKETQVAVALGHENVNRQRNVGTRGDFHANEPGFRRNLRLAPLDYDSMDNKDIPLEYIPIKFQRSLTPDNTTVFLENAHSLDVRKSKYPVKF